MQRLPERPPRGATGDKLPCGGDEPLPRAPGPRVGAARAQRPGCASRFQVSTTVSGLSEIDSIPCSISHCAKSA